MGFYLPLRGPFSPREGGRGREIGTGPARAARVAKHCDPTARARVGPRVKLPPPKAGEARIHCCGAWWVARK